MHVIDWDPALRTDAHHLCIRSNEFTEGFNGYTRQQGIWRKGLAIVKGRPG